MAKGDDIQERLIDFAVAILRLSAGLPKTEAGRHIAGQLLRCGTSPAANFAEARGAESRNDFIHKLKVVFKELNETDVWLKVAARSGLSTQDQVDPLLGEGDELTKIVATSIKTARANRQKRVK